MNDRRLFGLRITGAGDRASLVPLDALLAGAPYTDGDDVGSQARGSDILVRTRIATASPDTEDYRPAFFHGRLRGLQRAGEFLLVDGDSHVRVSADGRALDVATGPGSDASFFRITIFIGLAIALRHQGLYHLHAGALEEKGGSCALVMGTSGAGKSTVTLAMAAAGGAATKVLGDDALFLDGRSPEPTLVGFPRPFQLAPCTLAAFPQLESGAPDAAGKRPVALESIPGRSVSRLGPPHLVLFPQVTAGPITETTPLSPDEAFGRALHSAALVAVDGMSGVSDQLRLLGRLLGGARAYEVRLGEDLLSHPVRVARRLLDLGR